MPQIIQQRRGTAAQWTAANPVLALAEVGWEQDTGRRKTGDGASTWSVLLYDDQRGTIDRVPGLTAALALLQDRATAATDTEVASAVSAAQSALLASIALKQDATTAATDAEVEAVRVALATSISNLQAAVTTSLASKQDASLAATDAEVEAVRATLAAADALKIPLSQKGIAGGVAALNGSGLVTNADGSLPSSGSGSTIPGSSQTSAYTLAVSDAGTVVEVAVASAAAVTVPPNSAVALAVGSVVEVMQAGAGALTIAPGAGVTLRSPSGALTTAGQWSSVSLRKRATDDWVVQAPAAALTGVGDVPGLTTALAGKGTYSLPVGGIPASDLSTDVQNRLTNDTTAPTAPTALAATPGAAQNALTWTAATDNVGVAGYRVYRDGTLVGSPTTTSFTDTGLTNGTAYAYTVKAIDAAGNLSAASSSVSSTPVASAAFIAQDSFAGTAAASITTRAADQGGAWTLVTGFAANDLLFTTGGRIRRSGSTSGGGATGALAAVAAVPVTANYKVGAKMYVASKSAIVALAARIDTTTGDHYRFRYSPLAGTNGTFELVRFAGTVETLLASFALTSALTVGQSYQLEFECTDTVKRGTLDGTVMVSSTDNTLTAKGKTGVAIAGGTSSDTAGLHLDDFYATT